MNVRSKLTNYIRGQLTYRSLKGTGAQIACVIQRSERENGLEKQKKYF